MTGLLALVLHAHLPFVRHPEHEFFHEENWLFEAISESYVPLLQMMQRLLRRGVRFKLTLSVSRDIRRRTEWVLATRMRLFRWNRKILAGGKYSLVHH